MPIESLMRMLDVNRFGLSKMLDIPASQIAASEYGSEEFIPKVLQRAHIVLGADWDTQCGQWILSLWGKMILSISGNGMKYRAKTVIPYEAWMEKSIRNMMLLVSWEQWIKFSNRYRESLDKA